MSLDGDEEVHSRQLKVEGREEHPVAESDWAGDLFPQERSRRDGFPGSLSMVAEELMVVSWCDCRKSKLRFSGRFGKSRSLAALGMTIGGLWL